MSYIVPKDCLFFRHGDDMPNELRERLVTLAYECGESYDSYLITEPNRQYLWLSDLSGVSGFAIRGRYINVVGGLLTQKDQHWRVLNALREFASLNKLTISIFNVNHSDLDLFRDFEFQVTKFGEDFVIDIERCSFAGRRFDWVRRQANFCQRKGVIVEEILPDALGEDRWQELCSELLDLENELLDTKTQAQPTTVFQGRLTSNNLGRRRLFVAFSSRRERKAEGFVVLNPYRGGASWSVEIYRYRLDAPRGVAPYIIQQAILKLKEEGVREVSLCIIPGINCHHPMRGDSALCRRLMSFWYRHLNFITDMRGIYHFKSRFRPEQRPVYVCVYPRITIGSTIAFLMTWGVLKVDVIKVIKNIYKQLKNRRKRKSLANPTEAVV